ncbi:MAG TPA: hypothetical protein PK344_18025, partial [Syntrophorhabdaceae bacterium]|nr:hypothetical protein [Syntrophorhabdaceae bacterium]
REGHRERRRVVSHGIRAVGDVDLKNGSLWVRRTISAYVNVVESTKGRHKDRIPLVESHGISPLGR